MAYFFLVKIFWKHKNKKQPIVKLLKLLIYTIFFFYFPLLRSWYILMVKSKISNR